MPVRYIATQGMWSKALWLAVAISLSILSLSAAPAHAVVLNAGDTLASASAADPEPGANLLASTKVALVAPTFSGFLVSKVFDNDPTNPNGLSALTFTYEFSNAGPNALSRFTVSSYAGFATNVFYVNGPDVDPWLFDRSASGDVMGFSYIGAPIGFGKVTAGKASDKLVVQTSATAYAATFAAVINGSTATPASFAPTTIVPEPTSLALACFGLLGCAGYTLRQRRK